MGSDEKDSFKGIPTFRETARRREKQREVQGRHQHVAGSDPGKIKVRASLFDLGTETRVIQVPCLVVRRSTTCQVQAMTVQAAHSSA